MDMSRRGQLRVLAIAGVGVALLFGCSGLVEVWPRRLVTEGQVAHGQVTESERENGEWIVVYEYRVNDVRFVQGAPHVPIEVGTAIDVVYLPEHPHISWPERPPSEPEIHTKGSPFRGLGAIVAGVGAAYVVAAEVARRRAESGQPEALAVTGGRMLWLMLAGVLVSVVRFDSASGAVIDRAFALDLLGLPTTPIRALAMLMIVAPGAWTAGDVMALQMAKPPSAGSVSFLLWALGPEPARLGLGRERTRALLTILGYIGLMGAWIAFANYRGV